MTPRWESHVVEVVGGENETHLVWRSDSLPIAEWYWLAGWENPDEAANTMPPAALDALVAAVRDAAVLRQARELRARIPGIKQGIGTFAADDALVWELLDLLSPAPEGEGT